MRYSAPRKTTPKVRGGKVQRKNRTALSPHYETRAPGDPVIERHRPGPGYRHVLLKRDVEKFLGLLPDWEELSAGLKAVLLAPGERNVMGWCTPGVVAVCAWDRELAGEHRSDFVAEHRDLFRKLEVSYERSEENYYLVHWTQSSAKTFQLMHILLHEIGHHHDRITTRSRRYCSRGEGYAERYAARYADRIWDAYFEEFGW